MKRLGILLVCFATLAFSSCDVIQQAAGSNTAAQAMGQTCGSALVGLYNSYRATGSLNLATGNNLTNALALVTCYTQIRQNKDNANYRKSFIAGMVLNGAGLITNKNASNIVNALLLANGLTGISQSNTTAQNNTAANNSIVPIFNSMKK